MARLTEVANFGDRGDRGGEQGVLPDAMKLHVPHCSKSTCQPRVRKNDHHEEEET